MSAMSRAEYLDSFKFFENTKRDDDLIPCSDKDLL